MLAAIFAAADAQVRAAGGLLAGGHTIRDEEPKYGLAVIGTVHPEGIWPKNGAQPGDALFLTKPLGTGLIMTGYKQGLAGTQQLTRAIRWMRTLNKAAADVLRPLAPNAVTDVTGFGLFGHAHEMADRSGARLVLESERFPAIDGALDLARKGIRTSGDPETVTLPPPTFRVRASSTRSKPLVSTRRRPAACSSRFPRSAAPRSRPSSKPRSSSSGASAGSKKARASSSGSPLVNARGMIHGRFQPFHNGHLEYLRGAAERSEEVFVGITNPDPARIRPEPSDRRGTSPNPTRGRTPSGC